MTLLQLPERRQDTHKGDYGRILVIGGSVGMAGAPALSAMAALRSGAGLVTVATAASCQATVASFHPAIMTVGLPTDANGRIDVSAADELSNAFPKADCIAIGPGLGQSPGLSGAIKQLYAESRQTLVVDADGLNNLGRLNSSPAPAGQRILTPHPGEFARLSGREHVDRASAEAAASALAGQTHSLIVLKGHRTYITDGDRSTHNATGNAGMATAGSGDVLTGIIAAFIGQGLSPWDGAVLACHVHGLAGDLAAAEFGEPSIVATDLIDFLAPAILRQTNTSSGRAEHGSSNL